MNTQAAGASGVLPGHVLDHPHTASGLLDALADLLRDVRGTDFPLQTPGVEAVRASRTRLEDQLADHLLPRLRRLSAPAVVVVSGSTGAGKSTLVNSLVGREVTQAGVLRPTTRRPVLVRHPEDAGLLADHPVTEQVEVVADEQVPRGVALMDAPDLDSVEEANRRAAGRLLEAADLWLFVTTAARYGDALPWRVLAAATARGATVAVVLNRVESDSLPTVRADLLRRLRERGMQGSPLFVIPDVGPHEGPLEPAVVAPVRRWLAMLAGPDRARSVIARTLRGSLAALRPWVDELADAVQEQAEAADALRTTLADAVRGPAEEAAGTVDRGAVAHGAPQARWAELTAPGGPLSDVRPGRSLPRSGGASRSAALGPLVADVTESARSALVALGASTERTLRAALDAGPAGGTWVDEQLDPVARAADRETAVAQSVQEWSAGVTAAVEQTMDAGADVAPADRSARRAVARSRRRARSARRALGDAGLAAVVLAGAAGLAEAEDLAADLLGSAGQRLVAAAHADLVDRARTSADQERVAAAAVLDRPGLAPDADSLLRLRLAVVKDLT